ncbi:unnamed protein product [Notodromas monacha]|uniref:Carbohydrate kinase PfkB domain-containing protein n=1 Tax=Notodromas monacha TaxID=399045 RepID=A0A7R9BQM5_9CRUS|nr:unnamed protein product [Notodromas monacha]CAG0918956.1 unnamed protein product [Notodromas monacha]
MKQTVGGVGRNVAQCLRELGVPAVFIAAVGEDITGRKVLKDLSCTIGKAGNSVKQVESGSTASFIVVLDKFGQHHFEAGDIDCMNQLSVDHLQKFKSTIEQAPLVFMDGNIPDDSMTYLLEICGKAQVPVFFEPTTASLAQRPILLNKLHCLTFASPNIAELVQMSLAVAQSVFFEPTTASLAQRPILLNKLHCLTFASPNIAELVQMSLAVAQSGGVKWNDRQLNMFSDISQLDVVKKVDCLVQLCKPLVHHGPMAAVLVTMGSDGLLVVRKGQPEDSLLPVDKSVARPVSVTHYPVKAVERVVSVSGAGDCLAAAFISAMLAGKSQHYCAAFAQACARATLSEDSTVPELNIESLQKTAEAMADTYTVFESC